MKNKIERENELLKNLFLLIIIVTFFWQLRNSFLTTSDDIEYYILTQNKTIKQLMMTMANSQGRVRILLSWFFVPIPFLFDSKWYIVIIGNLCVVINLFLYYYIIKNRINKNIAFITLLMFIIFFSNNLQHNLITSYPLYLQLPLTFLLISIELFLQSYEENKNFKLIFSSMLFLFSMFFYEGFITYIFIFLYLSWINRKKKKWTLIDLIKKNRIHIIVCFLYLIIHILFSIMHKSNYEGTQINIKNIGKVVEVFWKISTGLFPMVPYWHLNNIDKIYANSNINTLKIMKMQDVDIIWIIKGILSSVFIIFCLEKIDDLKEKAKKILVFYPLIIYCIFIPTLPIAITKKYQDWTQYGVYSYTISYYSYYFIIFLIVGIIILFYSMKFSLKIKKIILVIVITTITVCTSYNNYYINKVQEIEADKNILLSELVKSEYFQKIEDNSYIYVPTYNGINLTMEYSEAYIKMITGKTIKLTNEIKEVDFTKYVYFLDHYVNNENKKQEIIIGKIDENFYAQEVFILKNEKIGPGSLVYYKKNKEAMIIPVDLDNSYHVLYEPELIDIKTVRLIEEQLSNGKKE